MTRDRAVLDANVLYAYFLRDLLLSLFAEGLYEAKWTDRINAEWVEHLLENDPNTSPDILKRTLQLMNAINPSPLVTDYEELIATLQLPDPNDRHVLAAAIASRANKIVTWNLKDFPDGIVNGFGIAAQNPDDFIHGLLIADPQAVVATLREMRRRLRRPSLDSNAFLDALAKNLLTQTRNVLERFASLL
jgi:predicted nucleic acid-binding protein